MNNLDIIDKKSGLILFYEKDLKRLAKTVNEDVLEIREKMIKTIDFKSIKYFVKLNTKEIIPLSKNVGLKTPGEYFDTYEEALNFSNL